MKWALIATVDQLLTYYVDAIYDSDNNITTPGYWTTITAIPGTVVNLIAYDGVTSYTPPPGTQLQQISDSAKIGDIGYTN